MSELKPFVFIAIVETPPNKVGYRAILVGSPNEDTAIGYGMKELADRFPECNIMTPSVIELTNEKLEEIRAPLNHQSAPLTNKLIEAADELERAVLAMRTRANGDYEADDGERAYMVHSDEMFLVEQALTAYQTARESAGEVKVKPLVWNYFEVRGHFDEIGVWDANSILGTFTIEKHGVGEFCLKPPKSGLRKPKRDLEEVKADAMLVLTTEIRSALAGG